MSLYVLFLPSWLRVLPLQLQRRLLSKGLVYGQTSQSLIFFHSSPNQTLLYFFQSFINLQTSLVGKLLTSAFAGNSPWHPAYLSYLRPPKREPIPTVIMSNVVFTQYSPQIRPKFSRFVKRSQNKRLLSLHASLRLESSLSCFSQLFQNRLPPSITAVVAPSSLLGTSYDPAKNGWSSIQYHPPQAPALHESCNLDLVLNFLHPRIIPLNKRDLQHWDSGDLDSKLL